MSGQFDKLTSIFGLRLWVALGVSAGAAFVLLLFLLSLWITSRRTAHNRGVKSKSSSAAAAANSNVSVMCKAIQVDRQCWGRPSSGFAAIARERESPIGYNRIQIEIGKDHWIFFSEKCSSSGTESRGSEQMGCVQEVSHLGWGHWYTLRELEVATNGLAVENVIGSCGYGIVYHGVLPDGSQIVVKNLLNNKLKESLRWKCTLLGEFGSRIW